jgi:predicted transcriptional regulator
VRDFGDLEAVIMDLMWRRDRPATVREVHTVLANARPLAYTTVMTVMDNLHRKRFLDREMAGRAWRYHPSATREMYAARLMHDALDATGEKTTALAYFVAGMSESEAQALRWLLRPPRGARR